MLRVPTHQTRVPSRTIVETLDEIAPIPTCTTHHHEGPGSRHAGFVEGSSLVALPVPMSGTRALSG
jgi:hypothetical protein